MNNKNSWGITFSFFVNNQGHAFALKLAYGFWGSKWLTMIAQQFDQVTYVCEGHRNYQYSKSIFMISDLF